MTRLWLCYLVLTTNLGVMQSAGAALPRVPTRWPHLWSHIKCNAVSAMRRWPDQGASIVPSKEQ